MVPAKNHANVMYYAVVINKNKRISQNTGEGTCWLQIGRDNG
jgi:hypothetical protein